MLEKQIIKLIESLDRIMDTWHNLTIRRVLLISYSILIIMQTIITTLFWIFNKDISETWLGVMTVEYGIWATMIGFYFSERKRNERGD